METNINFKNHTTDKQTLSNFRSTYTGLDADQQAREECSNETLNWMLKNASGARQYDLTQMQKSLDAYTAEFADYAISTTMHSMLQRANPFLHEKLSRLKYNLDPKDSLEILYITMMYLLFNQLELTHFMTSIQYLTENDVQIAATSDIINSHIYNTEVLQKKSQDYLAATALALQVGLIVKTRLEDKSSPLRYKDVFVHLQSFDMLDTNEKLRVANPKLGEWLALDLNDWYKKMIEVPQQEMPTELYFDENEEDVIYDSPRKMKPEGDADGEHDFDVQQFHFVASDDIEQFFN